MELLDSHSNYSILHLPGLRPCGASDSLRSEPCKRRGGWIEPERARSARYCSSCAPIVRREQSKLGKRKLRADHRWRTIWRAKQQESRRQRRKDHCEYMRIWRARRRLAQTTTRAEEPYRAA